MAWKREGDWWVKSCDKCGKIMERWPTRAANQPNTNLTVTCRACLTPAQQPPEWPDPAKKPTVKDVVKLFGGRGA